MLNPTFPLNENLESIRKALATIEQAKWGYTYDGSSDWTVGELPDPQGKPICSLWSNNDEWARNHATWIAASKDVVEYLLKVVEIQKEACIEAMTNAAELDDRTTLEEIRKINPMVEIPRRKHCERIYEAVIQKRLAEGKP